jgi:hypothetical protein
MKRMPYQGEQPSLDEYPLDRADGQMTPLAAETVYRFINDAGTDGYWLAGLLVESSFPSSRTGEVNKKKSVRIYRWRWRQPRSKETDRDGKVRYVPVGPYRWVSNQKHNINKRAVWEDTKRIVERLLDEMLKSN